LKYLTLVYLKIQLKKLRKPEPLQDMDQAHGQEEEDTESTDKTSQHTPTFTPTLTRLLRDMEVILLIQSTISRPPDTPETSPTAKETTTHAHVTLENTPLEKMTLTGLLRMSPNLLLNNKLYSMRSTLYLSCPMKLLVSMNQSRLLISK